MLIHYINSFDSMTLLASQATVSLNGRYLLLGCPSKTVLLLKIKGTELDDSTFNFC